MAMGPLIASVQYSAMDSSVVSVYASRNPSSDNASSSTPKAERDWNNVEKALRKLSDSIDRWEWYASISSCFLCSAERV